MDHFEQRQAVARKLFTTNLIILSQYGMDGGEAEYMLNVFIDQCVTKFDNTGIIDLEEQAEWSNRVEALTEKLDA